MVTLRLDPDVLKWFKHWRQRLLNPHLRRPKDIRRGAATQQGALTAGIEAATVSFSIYDQ